MARCTTEEPRSLDVADDEAAIADGEGVDRLALTERDFEVEGIEIGEGFEVGYRSVGYDLRAGAMARGGFFLSYVADDVLERFAYGEIAMQAEAVALGDRGIAGDAELAGDVGERDVGVEKVSELLSEGGGPVLVYCHGRRGSKKKPAGKGGVASTVGCSNKGDKEFTR